MSRGMTYRSQDASVISCPPLRAVLAVCPVPIIECHVLFSVRTTGMVTISNPGFFTITNLRVHNENQVFRKILEPRGTS